MKKMWLAVMAAALLASAGCRGQESAAGAESSAQSAETETKETSPEDGTREAGETDTQEAGYPYHISSRETSDWKYSDEEDASLLVSAKYNLLAADGYTNPDTGRTETANPEIAAAVAAVNADTEKYSRNFISENADDAEEMKKQLGTTDFMSYENDNHVSVVRADSGCFTVTRENYTFLGGAHGFSETTAYTFDASTGKRLKLSDLMKDTEDLPEFLAKEVVKQNEQSSELFDADGKMQDGTRLADLIADLIKGDGYEGDNDTRFLNWYADRDGICFVFNQYDIGPYAAGKFFVNLAAKDYPDRINAQYFNAPEEYIEQLEADRVYSVDGADLKLTYHYDPSSDFIEKVTLDYAGKQVSYEPYSFRHSTYHVHTKNGDFILCNAFQENDWQSLNIVKLSKTDEMKFGQEEVGVYDAVMVDPEAMILSSRTELLSSMTMEKSYHIDENGRLAPNTKYFSLKPYEDFKLTLKKDIELEVLDSQDSEETRREPVKKGTKVSVVRTDNKTIADCLTDDGRLVRFHVNGEVWPHIVEEKYPIEDLLDNVIFAG